MATPPTPVADADAVGRGRAWWIAAVVGTLASLGAPVLAPFPLLVLSRLRGWRLPERLSPASRLLLATVVAGLLLETGAWAHNLMRATPEPALFHPQLFADLLIGFGFYLGWWLAWWLLARRFRFTVREVFVVTALYGVLIEQQGRVFLAGLSTLPAGVLLWLFVALAYGSTMALAWTWAGDPWPPKPGAPRRRRKYPLAWIALFAGSTLLTILWNLPIEALHLLPPKRLPMAEHPFW